MRLGSFTYLLKQGAKNTYLNKAMSAASAGVLTACLVLVGLTISVSENIQSIVGYVQQQNEIIVYVEDNLSQDEESLLDSQIRALPNISEIKYTSKEEAFESQHDKLGELLDGYENEDIFPASYSIKVKDLSIIDENVAELSKLEGVYKIDAPTNVIEVMLKVGYGVSFAASIVVFALLIVSVVIIMNTIKITVFGRRREINIMKYVGATNSFIRMPFVVEGIILGLGAVISAFATIWIIYEWAYSKIEVSTENWLGSAASSLIPFSEIAWTILPVFLLMGVAAGAFASAVSVRKHLKV